MLNRRQLRIKVLQALYAYFQSGEENFEKAEKELLQAIERIYDLYIYLLLTFNEVRHVAEYRIEENKKKIRPKKEDLEPNLKFVENQFILALVQNNELRAISEKRKVNWIGDEHQEMFRKIFLQMKESETYISHMNSTETGFEPDKQFAMDLFKAEIANSELLYNFFEEKSIHWLDDIDLACSMALKTVKAAEENKEIGILPLYKKDDDEKEFVLTLMRKTLSMNSINELLIDELTENWELDRIAKMDIILLKMAITELQLFSSIPTKVTLNEYIEIAKFYSTPKSNIFINGVLDKAVERLKKEKKIVKTGRGLIN
jgi:N utilization substance protein B